MKTSYLKGVADTVSQITEKQIGLWSSTGSEKVEIDVVHDLSALTLGIGFVHQL